jgi:Fe-S-cluster containining protein
MDAPKDKVTFYSQGLAFSCQKCSACCRGGPGYVFLTESDVTVLSRAKGIPIPDFLDEFCRVIQFGDEFHYSLREKRNYDCVFWDDGCLVYGARPIQCRTYPYWSKILSGPESWKEESKYCPGIGKGDPLSEADIIGKLEGRAAEALIGPAYRKRFP